MWSLGESKRKAAMPLIQALGTVAKADQGDDRLLFRGQSSSGWSLCPGIFRARDGKVLPLERRRERLDRLSLCLDEFMGEYGRFRQGTEQAPKRDFNEKMAIAQHYGLPTPLLDWTESALVAMFFSVAFWDGKAETVRVFAVARGDFCTSNGALLVGNDPDKHRQGTQRGELSFCVEKKETGSSQAKPNLTPRYMDEFIDGKRYFGGLIRYIDIKIDQSEFEKARDFFYRNRLSFSDLFPDSIYWAVHQIKMRHLI
jgi:FRG domain